MTELELHKSVAQYLDACRTPEWWWTTIPAGGGGKARGGKLKAQGYVAGTPDILIVYNGFAHWIELKTEKGRVSPEQKAVHESLRASGAWVMVCRSLPEVQGVLDAWRVPRRAQVA